MQSEKTTIRYKKRKGFCRNVLAEDVPVNSNPGVNNFVNNDSTLVFGCVMILVRSAWCRYCQLRHV